MRSLRHAAVFFSHEVRAEWRNPYILQSTLLYVICTVIIGYYGFRFIEPETWNALFWVVMVFVSVNSVSRTFLLESRERAMYYYTLTGPLQVYFARLAYNVLFLWIISIVSASAFALFLGDVVSNKGYFLLVLLLASLSLGGTFTMVSALASRARNNYTMASIMGFPLVIPQLLLLIDQSGSAIAGAPVSSGYRELIGLFSISMLTVIVSYLIFPYLWRE